MTTTSTTTAVAAPSVSYDHLKEIKEFDESKVGVKGLVDSGLTTVPRFFIHPPETLSDINSDKTRSQPSIVIPTIDLAGIGGSRQAIVEQISSAAREFGFFQVVNHGVPVEVMERTISRIRAFHDSPAEVKVKIYPNDRNKVGDVAFFSNFDLFRSKAASWRDTLQVRVSSIKPEFEEIPEICRDEILEWDQESKRVAEVVMELLCEGLGLEPSKLKKMTCLEGRVMVAQYYPYCPQPDLTLGITSHTDPAIVTLLVQDHIGGLQVKYGGGWVDVKPVLGALVINIGDILQMMSNEAYKSADHRVLANSSHEPRVSIAMFFHPGTRDSILEPFPELVSPEKPALYRQFTFEDCMKRFFSIELDNKSLTEYYRL